MKKNTLTILTIAAVVIVLGLLSWLIILRTNHPERIAEIYDMAEPLPAGKYGKWDGQVSKLLDGNSLGSSLPEKALVKKYCTDYRYGYQTPEYGDAMFYIYADLTLGDSEFYRELSRINALGTRTEAGGELYYIVYGTPEEFAEYSDSSSMQGGRYYLFELARIDESARSIVYLTAYQWDYSTNQFVLDFLEPLTGTA